MYKAFNRLLSTFLSEFVPTEVRARLDSLTIPSLDENGYDPFGLHRPALYDVAPLAFFMYNEWFRVSVFDIDNVPVAGGGIVIANHSGALPWDALMIAAALITAAPQARLVRPLVDRHAAEVPFVSTWLNRCGAVIGLMENAADLLASGQLLLVFPEGATGSCKPYLDRYRLQPFNVGFLELSVRARVPIIPVAVIGAEEQSLTLFNWEWLARRLGMAGFPVTPFWPWLGPAGLWPLPVKYRIFFGEPIHLDDFPTEWLEDPERLHGQVEEVRAYLQELVNDGLLKRPGPFF